MTLPSIDIDALPLLDTAVGLFGSLVGERVVGAVGLRNRGHHRDDHLRLTGRERAGAHQPGASPFHAVR